MYTPDQKAIREEIKKLSWDLRKIQDELFITAREVVDDDIRNLLLKSYDKQETTILIKILELKGIKVF